MNQWTILVVEDDHYSQTVICLMLEKMNLKVDMVSDGQSALQKLATDSYALAIIDLGLPGISGWELLSEIQNNPQTQNLRCIAVTAYHDSIVAQQAREAGFTAYFPKPLSTTFGHEISAMLSAS